MKGVVQLVVGGKLRLAKTRMVCSLVLQPVSFARAVGQIARVGLDSSVVQMIEKSMTCDLGPYCPC